MGLFSFLKKKEVIKPEKIKFKDISSWIQGKEQEIKDKTHESSKLIKEQILTLTNELEKEIHVLEEVDLKEVKAEERIKMIVKGNLNTYITHLEKLIADLNELDDESIPIERITSIFASFEEKSSINLEKATFLIGEELRAVKMSIGNFFKYMKKNVDKDVIKTSRILSSIKIKLQEIDENNKTKQEIASTIMKLEERRKELEIQQRATKDKIKKILSSETYREEQKRKEEREKEKERLGKTIDSMKVLIDFKALANVCHSSEKDMEIIKSHKENFQDSFQKDNGKSILRLLDETKLNNQAIQDKVKEINSITIDKEFITKDDMKELESAIKEIKVNIENLDREKARELKREGKIKAQGKEILNVTKEELAEINVVLS